MRTVLRELWIDSPACLVDPGGLIWRAWRPRGGSRRPAPHWAPGVTDALKDIRGTFDHGMAPGTPLLHTRTWARHWPAPWVNEWRRTGPPGLVWSPAAPRRTTHPGPVHTAVVTNCTSLLQWARRHGVMSVAVAQVSTHLADAWARDPQWGPQTWPAVTAAHRMAATTAALYGAGATAVVPHWTFVPYALGRHFAPRRTVVVPCP